MPAILITAGRQVVRPVNLAQLTQPIPDPQRFAGAGPAAAILKRPRQAPQPRQRILGSGPLQRQQTAAASYEIADLGTRMSGGDCTLKFNACART